MINSPKIILESNINLTVKCFKPYKIDYLKKIKIYYLGCLGLEPRTNRLKAEYSTIELATLTK